MRDATEPRSAARARGPAWVQGACWSTVVSFSSRVIRHLRSRPVRRLRINETLSLGEKRQLLLIECGGRQLLIGAAGNFMATLAELGPAADANEATKENSVAAPE